MGLFSNANLKIKICKTFLLYLPRSILSVTTNFPSFLSSPLSEGCIYKRNSNGVECRQIDLFEPPASLRSYGPFLCNYAAECFFPTDRPRPSL